MRQFFAAIVVMLLYSTVYYLLCAAPTAGGIHEADLAAATATAAAVEAVPLDVLEEAFTSIAAVFEQSDQIGGRNRWYNTSSDSISSTSSTSSTGGIISSAGGGRIGKTIYHPQVRLLFVAGLEGTGHHAWKSMLDVCAARRLCVVEEEMTRIMMRFDPHTRTVHGLFGAADVDSNAAQVAALYRRMKEIAAAAEQAHAAPALHLLGLCFVKYSAMMSYPNYNGLHKSLDHPDISVMAAAAEAAGIDLRVLVLQRNAQEILRSTQKRQIGPRNSPYLIPCTLLYRNSPLISCSNCTCRWCAYRDCGQAGAWSRRYWSPMRNLCMRSCKRSIAASLCASTTAALTQPTASSRS